MIRVRSSSLMGILFLTALLLIFSYAWTDCAQESMLKISGEELITESELVATGMVKDINGTVFRKVVSEPTEDDDQLFVNQRPYVLNVQQLPSTSIPVKYIVNTNDGANFSFDYDSTYSLTNSTSSEPISIGDAVDAPHLPWATGGDASWFGQTDVTYDGVDAAQSGPITHDQVSWVKTSVTGPGLFSFWWKVSSEENWDFLDFLYSTDGENYNYVDWISGEVDWHQKSYFLEHATTYYFAWSYDKNDSISHGSDCGWLDQVSWNPGYLLSVNSINPAIGVDITSSTDQSGSTPYHHILEQDASVILTAPEYFGSGASRKKFISWSGDVKSTNRTINLTMDTNRSVTANYEDDPVDGSVQVNINPDDARDAGAQWRLTSISTDISSASSVPELLHFKDGPYEDMEKDMLFVKFKPEMTPKLGQMKISTSAGGIAVTGISDIDMLNQRYGASVFKSMLEPLYEISEASNQYRDRHRNFGLHLWYEVRIDAKQDIKAAVNAYSKLNQVETAEPVYKKKLFNLDLIGIEGLKPADHFGEDIEFQSAWTPDDPSFTNQWHYHNTGQVGGTPGADIDLIRAWGIEKGNPDVIVAIVDEGIQYDHPDINANMWPTIGPDGTGTVPGNHGTHVAGTVAAVSNNSIGVTGIAGGSGNGNGVRLMSVDIFNGSHGYNHLLIYAYQADNGAAISQNSWGFVEQDVWPASTKAGIDYFNTYGGGKVLDGGLTIFAAGNNNDSGNWYPARYEGVMAVAATNNQDIKAWYSNYGSWIDISAPGGETNELTERGVLSTVALSGYDYYQGTSMACPHVSGVAALMVSHAPGQFTASEIRNMLKDSADDHYGINTGYAGQLGSGRLNAYKALLKVQKDAWRNSGDIISNLAPGNYTINFKDVDNWFKPEDIVVTVNADEITIVTGTYNFINSDLSALVVTPGKLVPSFAPGTTAYSVEVAHNVSSLEVAATLADENATMTIDGDPAISGEPEAIDLEAPGMAKEIEIVVTAEDGVTRKTYNINVFREAVPLGDSADLSAISVAPGTLDPSFAPGTTAYSVEVAHNVSSLDVAATLDDDNASMTIGGDPATSGVAKSVELGAPGTSTSIEIVATAEDGESTKTYTITTTVLSLPTFSDVAEDHPFHDEIYALAAAGITEGYPDGTFRPSNPVTRMAMAAFLYRGLNLEDPVVTEPTFSDVAEDHPFFTEIEALAASKITTGYDDGTFKPSANVTRMATAVFLYRALELPDPGATVPTFSDVPLNHPFFTEIEALAASKITTGYADGTFRPSDNVTRMAMAAFLVRALELED